MNEQNEKPSLLTRVVEVGKALGSNLTTVLTIFSAIAGILFLRERGKRIKAETDTELKDTAVKVETAKDKAKEAENEAIEASKQADSSYDAYKSAKDTYDKG
jgi:uncharacterized membrane protein (UPF0182 family)